MVKTKVNFEKKVFDIKNEPMPRGSWWWWFWLFFFDNPENPKKPRQLMILWSTKNERTISCNDVEIKIPSRIDKKSMKGVVAAWYFDGKEMHHNFLLEKCVIKLGKDALLTDKSTKTAFSIKGKMSTVTIGEKMKFIADEDISHDFTKARYKANKFVGNKGYSIMKINRAKLRGTVDGEKVNGTAYFQRVFVNSPAIPWYWGIFHFENGAAMTYTNQLVFGRSIRKDITFFDGKSVHNFKNVNVKRVDAGSFPDFEVKGENGTEKIKFTVVCYEHSSWTFKKNTFGIIPNKLVYNEYPCTITDIVFENTKTGKNITSEDLGFGVGNAEHTTGMLL